MFFKHFVGKNQLSDLSVSETLVENELRLLRNWQILKLVYRITYNWQRIPLNPNSNAVENILI